MATKTLERPPQTETNGDQIAAPLATIPKTLRDGIRTIEQIARTYGLQAIAESDSKFERAIILAEGIGALRKAMNDEVMGKIMPLQGTRLGFKTDRDTATGDKPNKYPLETVREVMIEMVLRGFLPVGNEINIIAGNGYATKEGYERALSELEGVTDIQHMPGVPQMGNGGALVPYVLQCRFHGDLVRIEKLQTPTIDNRIVVRVNSGMGADGILGKAHRKISKAMYDRLTKSVFTTADADLDDRPAVSSGAATLTLEEKLAARSEVVGAVADAPTEAVATATAAGDGTMFGGGDGPHADKS